MLNYNCHYFTIKAPRALRFSNNARDFIKHKAPYISVLHFTLFGTKGYFPDT